MDIPLSVRAELHVVGSADSPLKLEAFAPDGTLVQSAVLQHTERSEQVLAVSGAKMNRLIVAGRQWRGSPAVYLPDSGGTDRARADEPKEFHLLLSRPLHAGSWRAS